MNTDNIVGFLVSSGLLVALLALAMSGLKYLKVYLDKKIEELAANKKAALIAQTVAKANDAIWDVVFQLAQESADNLKAAASDGKLTPSEITQLRNTAYNRSVELMGTQTHNLLELYADDVEKWIYTKIDAIARETKLPQVVTIPVVADDTVITPV